VADLDTLESLDNFSGLRNALRVLSVDVGEWAGIPIPIEGERLVVDPSYPFANALSEKGKPNDEIKVRNSFYSARWRCDIYIYEEEGKLKHAKIPAFHGFAHQLSTLGASFAWGIEQEASALQLLATLVRHHQFKCYLLTGSFLESSAKSRVTYMFRKLRPTVVMHQVGEEMKIMCALCMHPIAYYADSWAGAMCPTDDVIAHLMLMRGDEAMFWKRCNQHAAHRPEAGL